MDIGSRSGVEERGEALVTLWGFWLYTAVLGSAGLGPVIAKIMLFSQLHSGRFDSVLDG